MTTLKSRFKFHPTYSLILLIGWVALAGLVKVVVSSRNEDSLNPGFLIGLLALWFLFIYSLYHVLKVPTVYISETGILLRSLFRKEQMEWKIVQSAEKSKKLYNSWATDFEDIWTISGFENQKVIIAPEHYSNRSKIIQVLERVKNQLAEGKPVNLDEFTFITLDRPHIDHQVIRKENFNTYSGYVYTHWHSLFLFAAIGCFLYNLILKKEFSSEVAIISGIGILLMYLFFGFQMHYFKMSDNYLVVSNHFFWWKKHIYRLKDIKEFGRQSYYRRSDGLRIILKDSSSRSYLAGSLWSNHWKQLISDFHSTEG